MKRGTVGRTKEAEAMTRWKKSAETWKEHAVGTWREYAATGKRGTPCPCERFDRAETGAAAAAGLVAGGAERAAVAGVRVALGGYEGTQAGP